MSEQPLTNLYLPKKKGKNPLKRSMSGYEVEMFALNSDGSMDHSDKIFEVATKRKMPIAAEVPTSMIELNCLPHKKLVNTSLTLVENVEQFLKLSEELDRRLYPFGTYPGQNNPVIRKKEWYNQCRKILGEKRYINATVTTGVHQHYTLPRGIFDKKKKFLNYSVNSKIKRTLLDSYNFLTAIDPIITTFMQSSPYVNNKYLAKDSRMLLWRGGEYLKYPQGLYGKKQFFGGLSPYKNTLNDLISTLRRRHTKWGKLLDKNGFPDSEYKKEKHILQISRNPIKVNPHGTLEVRSGDMNYISNIMGCSTMIKFALRKIQQDFTLVIPMDIEVKDSFKVEDNFLFIPPHSVVRKHLQYQSAYNGLANDDMYNYANAFFKFIQKEVYPEYMHLLKPIKEMLDSRKTISDKIIRYVSRKEGKEAVSEELAKEMAIKYSDEFRKDLEVTKESLIKVGD